MTEQGRGTVAQIFGLRQDRQRGRKIFAPKSPLGWPRLCQACVTVGLSPRPTLPDTCLSQVWILLSRLPPELSWHLPPEETVCNGPLPLLLTPFTKHAEARTDRAVFFSAALRSFLKSRNCKPNILFFTKRNFCSTEIKIIKDKYNKL